MPLTWQAAPLELNEKEPPLEVLEAQGGRQVQPRRCRTSPPWLQIEPARYWLEVEKDRTGRKGPPREQQELLRRALQERLRQEQPRREQPWREEHRLKRQVRLAQVGLAPMARALVQVPI